MYVIYMDLLFLINLVMDGMIFFIASMFLNKKVKLKKIFFASVMGACIFCLLLVFPMLQRLPYWLFAILVPIIPIIYLFKPYTWKVFLKTYLVCTLVAALIGGFTFSIWYMIGYNRPISEIGVVFIVAIGMTVGGIVYMGFYSIRERLIMPYFEYEMVLRKEQTRVQLHALLDSGNCLYTPIDHRPVIVVQYEEIKSLIPKKIEDILQKYNYSIGQMLATYELEGTYIIPFNSLGCKSGMLLGIEVDEVSIYKVKKIDDIEKCVIGIAFEPLFRDGRYKALLHQDFIVNGGM